MFLQVTFPRGGPGAEGVPTAGKRQQGLPTQAPGLMCGSTEYIARSGFTLELWKGSRMLVLKCSSQHGGKDPPDLSKDSPGKQSEPSCWNRENVDGLGKENLWLCPEFVYCTLVKQDFRPGVQRTWESSFECHFGLICYQNCWPFLFLFSSYSHSTWVSF